MQVTVPASSANLGPGFDCFGLAWQLYNRLDFHLGGEGLCIKGCPEQYRSRDNLAYQGFLAVLKVCGIDEPPLSIDFLSTGIPVSRGLGSSAALIAGGAAAANALYGLSLTREQLLDICTPIEGHPDNLAPAIFGGMTASMSEGERVFSVPCPVSDKLCFTVLIPDFELSTRLSRSVMPDSYPRADAVFNLSRAALLLKALESGDGELLSACLKDRLHQPYRSRLIPGYERLSEIAAGLGAAGLCISGAGSTLLCISVGKALQPELALAAAEEFPGWQVLAVQPDVRGVRTSP